MKVRLSETGLEGMDILSLSLENPAGTDRGQRDGKDRDSFGEVDIIFKTSCKSGPPFMAAIDLGSTTIAMALLNAEDGSLIDTETFVNGQHIYGADVISRIQSALEGKAGILRALAQTELKEGLRRLCGRQGKGLGSIWRIAVAGNTAMLSLLMGWDVSGLSQAPYSARTEAFLGNGDMVFSEKSLAGTAVTVFPGFSAFVGADIVSGIYSIIGGHGDMGLSGPAALVDLGTYYTSAPAGPAFEGAHIRCGKASIAGAICSVRIKGGSSRVKTICDKEPIGICGSGLLEAVSELLKEDLVDEFGCLSEGCFSEGYPLYSGREKICLFQEDIQEFIVAKAAIRAGFDALMRHSGIKVSSLKKLYLSGGLGSSMDVEAALRTGLIAAELKGRVEAVGNSSLSGIEAFLKASASIPHTESKLEHGPSGMDGEALEELKAIVKMGKKLELGHDKYFQERFIEEMIFHPVDL